MCPPNLTKGQVAALLVAGAAFSFCLLAPIGVPVPANRALATLVLMAILWVTEALPVHWTAALPLVIFPILHVRPGGTWANIVEAGRPYFDPNIFLFLGGMLLAVGMELHGLHKRIALRIMEFVGAGRLVLGFLLATSLISLWISNTATAVMMLPIALAVLHELERREGRGLPALGQAVMLAVAYGANVGGIGTKIGTAPNAQFAGFASRRYGIDVGFLDYLAIGLPFVVMFLPIVYVVLRRIARGQRPSEYSSEVLAAEIDSLGPMKPAEKKVGGAFLLACVLWIGSKPLKDALGLATDPDPVVSMAAAGLLFILGVLGPSALLRIPWGVLVLLGGSFSLANAIKTSGLADFGAGLLGGLGSADPFLLMLGIAFASVGLSAIASNTATTQLMLEGVATVLGATRPLPYLAVVPIAASCDFMLPAGTPPNAIVYGSGYVRLPVMASYGFLLDVAAAIVAALWCYYGVWWLIG